MGTSAAGPLVTGPGAGAGAAVAGVPSAPGWIVLRDCPIGGGGPPVGLALLHPKIGVALVDLAPEPTDTPGRLRRALEARRFPAIFGGYPPIVRAVLPADRLSELGQVLAARFAAQPRIALEGEDAWVRTARAALEAAPPAIAGAPHGRDAARRRDVPPWRAAVFIVAAAASGAALAAAVVMPSRPGGRNAPDPERAAAAAPVDERGAALRSAAFRPAPATGTDSAAEITAAAVPHGAEPSALDDNGRPEPLQPAPLEPFATGPAADPPDLPTPIASATTGEQPGPIAPAAENPDPLAGAAQEEQPPPTTRAARLAAPAPLQAQPRTQPAAPDRRPPPLTATAPASPAVPAAETADGRRCRDILVKTTLGEGLSDGDKRYMRRGCQQPRD